MRNVPSLETVYRDYAKKGVKFYYIYKALAHPEHNGYVNPFTLEERLMHIKEAERTLGSEIPWISDSMSNDIKHALGDAPNSEFVIDPQGKIVQLRWWSDPKELRKDLAKLVGPVANPTRVEDLNLKTAPPPKVAAEGVVPRVEVPGMMYPIVIKPKLSEKPFYAKLRAKVNSDIFDTGTGTLYLGFFMDPIYHVHWNNLAAPVKYELKAPAGTTVSPASGEGPKIEEPSDIDPREFLIDVKNGDPEKPLELSIDYFACNDEEGWCIPVTQEYTIFLELNSDGGRPDRRSLGGAGGPGGMVSRLLERDKDGDGKISKAEIPNRMKDRFDSFDQNGDGFIDKDEIEKMPQRMMGMGGMMGRAAGPGGMMRRLLESDTDGDGKISKAEAPDRMKDRFNMFDQNGDGFIDKAEIDKMSQRMGGRGGMMGGAGGPGGPDRSGSRFARDYGQSSARK